MLKKARHTQHRRHATGRSWTATQCRAFVSARCRFSFFAHAGSEGRASPGEGEWGGRERCLLLLIKVLSLLTAPPRCSLTAAETVTLESPQTGFYRVVVVAKSQRRRKDAQRGKEVRVRSRLDYTDAALQTHVFEHAEGVHVMQSRRIPNDQKKKILIKSECADKELSQRG